MNNKNELKKKTAEYQSLFVREPNDLPPARFGKTVYIRQEHHEHISQIVHVIANGNISLFGYIDNVLAEHFKNYRDEITQSFNEKRLY